MEFDNEVSRGHRKLIFSTKRVTMGVKFRKRIAIKLPGEIISRLRDAFSNELLSKNMTKHWQEREQVKHSSFDFSGSEHIYYMQDENGLDDYYPANFGYGQLLTPLSSIKKFLLRRYLRLDALALDPMVNYRLNKYREGTLRLSDLPYLDQTNPNWSEVRAVLISNLIQTFAPNFAAESILEIGPGSGNLLFQSSEIETPTTTASSMFEKLVCLSTSRSEGVISKKRCFRV